MKGDFNSAKGQRGSKGNLTPTGDWFSSKRAGRSHVVRTIHAQTVCKPNMTNAMLDAVVTQWQTKEGITYYTARATENKYIEEQFCHARIQVGPKVKVTKATNNLWYFINTKGGDKKCPF